MVTRVGGYYRATFQSFRGVTQGGGMSPTTFNVAVDAVVWHWVKEMVEISGGRGQEGRHQNALFCEDDRITASSDPGWLQGAFSTLVGMFYWLGLSTNVRKTVRMACHLCQVAGTQSEVAYERQMTGAVPSYQ